MAAQELIRRTAIETHYNGRGVAAVGVGLETRGMDGLRDVLRGYGYECLVGMVASLELAVRHVQSALDHWVDDDVVPLLFSGHSVLGTL